MSSWNQETDKLPFLLNTTNKQAKQLPIWRESIINPIDD